MDKHPKETEAIIIDAGALIDYCHSDPMVLNLISTNLGRLHVATWVLAEVKELDERRAAALGISVIEPNLIQMAEAAAGVGALSFADRICMILARDNGWTCITNDTALRQECRKAGIKVLWGLETLAHLVDRGSLTATKAGEIAEKIHQTNPYFINQNILQRFYKQIGVNPD